MGTPFSSNKIKYLSKKWKQNNYLHVAKLVGIFENNNEGFIDFTKWKHDTIYQVIHSNYSESDAAQSKSIMNDLITKMNLSKRCKVFQVINNKFSIVMRKRNKVKYSNAIQNTSQLCKY